MAHRSERVPYSSPIRPYLRLVAFQTVCVPTALSGQDRRLAAVNATHPHPHMLITECYSQERVVLTANISLLQVFITSFHHQLRQLKALL